MNRCLLFVALLGGCQHRDNDLQPSTPQPGAVETKPVETKPVDPNAISGTVLETMNASSYTYARLDRGGSEIWVAGPQTSLSVGAKLDNLSGQLMTSFYSKTLDRTFAQIYFVTSLGPEPVADPHTAVADPHATAPVADSAHDEISGTVVQTMDAAGYTYAQLDRNGTKAWVAGPTTKLAVGTKLGKMSGSLMTAFHSSTLNRTFDQIYFVDAYAITN